jgi:hypothetical protein
MKIILTSYRVPFGLYNIIVVSTNKISKPKLKKKINPKKKKKKKKKKNQQRCFTKNEIFALSKIEAFTRVFLA